MSSPDVLLAVSLRGLRRIVAIACAALLMMGSTANAGSTILQFTQAFPSDIVTGSNNGSGTTTLSTPNADGGGVSVPVIITNSYLGLPPFLAYETFVTVKNTDAATNIGGPGGLDFQSYSGKIEFTSGFGGAGINYLTATFSSALLSGTDGQNAATFSSAPVLTASTGFSFTGPTSMAIGFSNVVPILGISNGSIASFTAQNAGTFSASVVPEPGTLCLSSVAIVIGTLTYWRKRNSRS